MNTLYNQRQDAEELSALESHSIVVVDIPEANPTTVEKIESLAETMRSIQENLSKTFSVIIRPSIVPTLPAINKAISWSISDLFSPVLQSIADCIGALNIPEISDERRRELLDSHKKWASYGWTLIPIADDRLFDSPPANKDEANRIGRHACKDSEKLFATIESQKRVKKSDFSEAVSDFRDRRYKSCAMILFALIDAHLIRFQKKIKANDENRKVGIGAIVQAKKRIEADQTASLFGALFYANLFSCLFTMFDDTIDFSKPIRVINRNYLDHGMLTRKVTKTDCVQLFLLYYNVLEMLDLTYLTGD